MAFRFSTAAKQWFKYLKGTPGSEIEFDFYYYCFIVGVATGKKDTEAETTDLILNFPKDYAPHRNLIIALFLRAELKDLGIDITERTALDKQLSALLDPNSTTRLSDEGMKLLNSYANGGFLKIQEVIPEPPRNLDSFLLTFFKEFNPYFEKSI